MTLKSLKSPSRRSGKSFRYQSFAPPKKNIPCATCLWNYISETGRSFITRQMEHIRDVQSCAKGSNIARHAWSNDHRIDFDNASVINTGNYRVRKTLESWHTAATNKADKNSCTLPRQCSRTSL